MRRFSAALLAVVVAAGCADERSKPAAPAPPRPDSRPAKALPAPFVDVTNAAGIAFRHDNGATGSKLLPETMGGGAAFFDYDGNEMPDLLVVRGGGLRGLPDAIRCTVFRGVAGGRFELVPESAGPDANDHSHPQAMGVSVADYDGDGDDDLYVTAVGPNLLLRNENGVFRDVGAGADGGHWPNRSNDRHPTPAWSTASLWCDYDKDGDLDLFVTGYVQWTPESDIFTSLDGVTKAFTTPDRYTGLPVRLYRNESDDEFIDATEQAGLLDHLGKGLGIAMWDFDQNGFMDIVVANDTRPNFVFMNQGDGTFTEEGLAMRVAYDQNGRARAGMGIDVADYANDGVPGIAIGNFAGEPMSLYRAGKSGFVSSAEQAGLAAASTPLLAFGVAFADMDLDGVLDLVVVNGHIEPDIAKFAKEQTHAQRALLFLGRGDGTFSDATASAGADFAKPRVGRGLAIADYDRDGDLDLVITENGGPVTLLQNRVMETAPAHWLRVALKGRGKNTRGIGAVVTVVAGGKRQTRMVRTGSSYLSQSDVFPTFGLGAASRVDEVRVRWPLGAEEIYEVGAVDRTITLEE